jgi:C4-dicarboxylate transporter DctM subunit
MAVLIAAIVMVILMLFGVAVFVSFGLGSIFAYMSLGAPLTAIAARMYSGIDSYPLMAAPFFLLAAGLLEYSGVSRRIVDLADAIVGGFKAGVALSGLIACAIFASLSGSSIATLAGVGSIVIPRMRAMGYDTRFSIGSIAAGGTVGMLLPPSIPIILYAFVTNTSILALFAAGLVPALLLLGVLMSATVILARIGWHPGEIQHLTWPMRKSRLKGGAATLVLPAAIFAGIYGIPGVSRELFTPTEASVIAVVLAGLLVFVVYRDAPIRSAPGFVAKSMTRVGVVMAIVASAALFGFVVAASGAASVLQASVEGLHLAPWQLLLLYNILLLLVGDYLEAAPIILILVPIFFPIAVAAGIDPIQFGIITIVNIEVGTITPPVGINLLMASSISGMDLYDVFRAAFPWIGLVCLVLLAVTYVPEISLVLPHVLGLIR